MLLARHAGIGPVCRSQGDTMHFALSALAVGLFLWAAISDLNHRRIPNQLVLALLMAGIARIILAQAGGAGYVEAAMDAAMALTVFSIGAVLFHFRLLGGGDVKLMAAGALWFGSAAFMTFLGVTALAGGGLAVGFMIWTMMSKARRAPSLPYGVAIAVGGIAATAGAW
jgi:prepilin peptidase CpaA